ncbi:FAD-binding oxidoreductase [uncultured Litoreibacter sp.]|uniref:NAD(P)/FAD-dependent oxidoreductase n=1 Tax=uncultured Litoreibacter sp. TaxID=1392394 RepID=UPI0026209F5B|nr:FAD-binding oxidoreductase [uncultured Litoreibacter sp.]
MTRRVLIIGGGIAGISAAARISPDAEVTVLESENAIGYHATGRSAAAFLKDYGNDTVRALNYASANYLETHDLLSPRGMLLLAKPHQFDAFTADCQELGLTQLGFDEARQMVPILNADTCAFAAYREDVFDLDTDKMLQGFAKVARQNGAVIRCNAKVTSIVRRGRVWSIEAEEAYEADIIINAAGAWADQIAQMAGVSLLGFQPMRRSMARIPAPGGHDVTKWPFLHGVHDEDGVWYAKNDAGKWLVSPSEEHPMDPFDAYADDMVLAQGLARYEQMVTEPVTRLETSWAGLRTFAPDRALVLGRDATTPAFYWCAGQGGYGFQTAPAASQLLADLLAGRPPQLAADVVEALSPSRFSPSH